MKRVALLSVLASFALLAGGCICDNASDISNSRLRVRAFIDGSDVVKIRGDQIWIAHKSFEFPGRWQGCNEPIIVKGTEKWYPVWDGNLSDRHTIEDKERALPLKKAFTKDTMNVAAKTGLGNFYVSEYPSADNDYTLSVTLDDLGAEGASWYEFGVSWDDDAN